MFTIIILDNKIFFLNRSETVLAVNGGPLVLLGDGQLLAGRAPNSGGLGQICFFGGLPEVHCPIILVVHVNPTKISYKLPTKLYIV